MVNNIFVAKVSYSNGYNGSRDLNPTATRKLFKIIEGRSCPSVGVEVRAPHNNYNH